VLGSMGMGGVEWVDGWMTEHDGMGKRRSWTGIGIDASMELFDIADHLIWPISPIVVLSNPN
jgi:hypothetical protein